MIYINNVQDTDLLHPPPSATMQDHIHLPPELWLEIFEWATYNPNLHYPDRYLPFQPIPSGSLDSNLPVRLTLSRVCRTWQMWTAQSLYKDIEISHSPHALKHALEGREPSGRRYGELVQRVVLPYQSTGTFQFSLSLEVLGQCRYLHTLLRPPPAALDGYQFDNEVAGLSLPSLQRLEWWHHNEAERSGGINSLGAVLRSAPNIRYLFVGGVVGTTTTLLEPRSVTLENLDTLRLYIRSGLFLRQILSRWDMPVLTHLILDAPPVRELQEVWTVLGNRLRIVEFGKHIRFSMDDYLTPCLKGCPNLTQLNYHLFFTTPYQPKSHSNLATIGMHSYVNALLADSGSVWNLLESHFDILCSGNFPILHKVVLYGDWRAVLRHPNFSIVQKKLKNSGRILEIPDPITTRLY